MSDTRDIRLLALWRDDPTEAPMTLDLRIDARGGVVSTWDVFGAFDAGPFDVDEDEARGARGQEQHIALA